MQWFLPKAHTAVLALGAATLGVGGVLMAAQVVGPLPLVVLLAGVAAETWWVWNRSERSVRTAGAFPPREVREVAGAAAHMVGLQRHPDLVVQVARCRRTDRRVNTGAVDDVTSGSTVVISAAAISLLSRDQLAGVFAHAASHLLGWHPPLKVAVRATTHLVVACWLVVTTFGVVGRLAWWWAPVGLALALAGSVIAPAFSRWCEWAADRQAAAALPGGRRQLAESLLAMFRAELHAAADEHGGSVEELARARPVHTQHRVRQLWASRPSLRDRIDRLMRPPR